AVLEFAWIFSFEVRALPYDVGERLLGSVSAPHHKVGAPPREKILFLLPLITFMQVIGPIPRIGARHDGYGTDPPAGRLRYPLRVIAPHTRIANKILASVCMETTRCVRGVEQRIECCGNICKCLRATCINTTPCSILR